jgi:hypothetical protein
VLVVSDVKGYTEPHWFRPTVERLLSSLPDGYCLGLSSVVLTETVVTNARKRRRGPRKGRGGVALGRYHQAWNKDAAWIELVVDEIVKQLPKPLDKLKIARDVIVGRVLFHEIGHHLDATLGSMGRTGEHGAEAWEARLSRGHFRRRYGYLRPLVPVFGILAGVARRLARREANSKAG